MFITLLAENPLYWVFGVVVVIGSVVLHELGHVFAATWEGDDLPRLRGHMTWNPLVHMGWMSIAAACVIGIAWGQTPVNPSRFRHRRWGDTIVSFAGPAVHILLAAVSAFVLALVGEPAAGSGLIFVRFFWEIALYFNVLLLLFNMIPVPPFDGFTVASGFFNMGAYGRWARSAGMLPMLLVFVFVSATPFFGKAVAAVTDAFIWVFSGGGA